MQNTTFDIVVTGDSMWPVLVPGQRYTARRNMDPKLGDIVVATNPRDVSQTIVKRVSTIQVSSEQPAGSSVGAPASDRSPFTVHRSLFTLQGTVSWSSTFTVTRPQILGVVVL